MLTRTPGIDPEADLLQRLQCGDAGALAELSGATAPASARKPSGTSTTAKMPKTSRRKC